MLATCHRWRRWIGPAEVAGGPRTWCWGCWGKREARDYERWRRQRRRERRRGGSE